MVLFIVFVILCVGLVIGLPVPFAFGAALVYLGYFADTEVSTFLTSGHWRMNAIVLLAIPMFILARTSPWDCAGIRLNRLILLD